MLRRGGYKNRLSKFLSESYFNIIFKGNLLFNYRGNKTTIQKLCKMVKRKLISYYSSTQTTIVIILVEFLPGFLQMLLLIFFLFTILLCAHNILYLVFLLYCIYLIEFYIFKMSLVCILGNYLARESGQHGTEPQGWSRR